MKRTLKAWMTLVPGLALSAALIGCGGEATDTTGEPPVDTVPADGTDTMPPAEGTETPVDGTETPVDDTETPVEGTETPAIGETPAEETETAPAEAPETSETPAEETPAESPQA